MRRIKLRVQPSATSADNSVSDSDNNVKKEGDFLDEQSSLKSFKPFGFLLRI